MPALEQGTSAKVLVTGANGFIAMWIIHYILEQGYAVRGTVRSAAKAGPLKDHFRKYVEAGKLELVSVEDVSKAGAFNGAVKGVDAVIHTASPVQFSGDPDDIVNPAIQGTIGVLQSCLAYGPSIQRVVLTSSTGAIVQDKQQRTTVYSEKDWNESSVDKLHKLGKNTEPFDAYKASKVLAERAAWDFVEKHKNSIEWDFCTINPSYVFGPFLNDWNDIKSINGSSKLWYDKVLDPTQKPRDLLDKSFGCLDVRDAAIAHVLALQKPEAAGERFLLSAHNFVWQDMVDCVHGLNPPPSPPRPIPPLQQGIQKVYTHLYDGSKAKRILGIGFRSLEEMVRDMLDNFSKRGI